MGVDFNELMSESAYKEKYRKEMIEYGEEIRKLDKHHFCRTVAHSAAKMSKKYWIIADCRRTCDFEYFQQMYPKKIILVRVESTLETRIQRGFIFKLGIDDAESECGLDDFQNFDFIIHNEDFDIPDIDPLLKHILDFK